MARGCNINSNKEGGVSRQGASMNYYQYSLSKIKTAKTVEQLDKVEVWLEKMYNAGVSTPSEFSRLDDKLVDHSLKLEGIIS